MTVVQIHDPLSGSDLPLTRGIIDMDPLNQEEPERRSEEELDELLGENEYSVYYILNSERRRECLKILYERGESMTTSELSEEIAMSVFDIDSARPGSKERKRVYVGLYQTHLEKLDKSGLVDWDEDANVVTPNLDEIGVVVSMMDTIDNMGRLEGYIMVKDTRLVRLARSINRVIGNVR